MVSSLHWLDYMLCSGNKPIVTASGSNLNQFDISSNKIIVTEGEKLFEKNIRTIFTKFPRQKLLFSNNAYNQFHNILRLFDVLPNFLSPTSGTMCDYYL